MSDADMPIISTTLIADWMLICVLIGLAGNIVKWFWDRFSSWRNAQDRIKDVEAIQKNLVLGLAGVEKLARELHREMDDHIRDSECHISIDATKRIDRMEEKIDWIYQHLGGKIVQFPMEG